MKRDDSKQRLALAKEEAELHKEIEEADKEVLQLQEPVRAAFYDWAQYVRPCFAPAESRLLLSSVIDGATSLSIGGFQQLNGFIKKVNALCRRTGAERLVGWCDGAIRNRQGRESQAQRRGHCCC